MNVRIEKKPAFWVAGHSIEVNENSNFEQVWIDLYKRASDETLRKLGNGKKYGVIYNEVYPESLRYIAGYDLINTLDASQMDIELVDVPKQLYAVIEVKGRVPQCIKNAMHYAHTSMQIGRAHV